MEILAPRYPQILICAMSTKSPLRLAVDIGGTFTDTVLTGGDQVLATAKTLTTDEERRLERSFVSVIQKEGLAREQLVTAIQQSLQPRV